MSDDIRRFLSQGASNDPVFKFTSVGDEIHGKIAEEPKLLPQNKYKSDEPKLDDDGNPVMQLLLVLDTEAGRCRVYIDKSLQRAALRRALDGKFADSPAVGGAVWMKRVDDVHCQNGSTAYDFQVDYTPPSHFGDNEPLGVGALETGGDEAVIF